MNTIMAFKKIAAGAGSKERDYWVNKFSTGVEKSCFPSDTRKDETKVEPFDKLNFEFSHDIFLKLLKLSKGKAPVLHMIFIGVMAIVLQKYTGAEDITLGVPIYKQDVEGTFINTVLPLRISLREDMVFKELLMHTKEILVEALDNQNYPIEALLYQLNLTALTNGFPLFDVVVLVENIHDKRYLDHIHPNMVFCFKQKEEGVAAVLEYNPSRYSRESVEKITGHFTRLTDNLLTDVNIKITEAELLSEEEKKQVLQDFNDTYVEHPQWKTIGQLFAEQVAQKPDHIATAGYNRELKGVAFHFLSYLELSGRSNQLARLLRKRGVQAGDLVALLLERTIDMIIAIFAVIKAGGAYLPISADTPLERVRSILNDARVSLLLTQSDIIAGFSLTSLQSLQDSRIEPYLTTPRRPINDLDTLPMPDRSFINYEIYARNISLAMVKQCITLQGTRGCPYNCAYCARLWPKKQVVRSAENLFAEVKHYYDMGVRRFSIIDDIFNLDTENSSRFFRLIIKNGFSLQLHFPAGLRGDIMTEDYIDLMVEAGTVNISVALETASPRLQKLIRKNLNIDRLQKNLVYICSSYPHIILDLFTMHGLPTETEKEAEMTLDFIKSLKWLHFPLINITRIYPDTDLEKLALASSISREAILRAESLPWHEASETLPFEKNFTTLYQADFLDNYFLKKERLQQVLPFQMKVLTEDEIACKYNSYLPTDKDIKSLEDLLKFAGIEEEELASATCVPEEQFAVPGLNSKIRESFSYQQPEKSAFRILLLDLSQSYSWERKLLDELFEQPLGLIYLLSWLKRRFGRKIDGRIAKSGIDFDNDSQLKKLLTEFKPRVIGIRTLTFYKDFFHRTVAKIRQWGYDMPIITGGPYATNGYKALLQDRNIDLVVRAEGEVTFAEVIAALIKSRGRLPGEDILVKIPGIAFIKGKNKPAEKNCGARDILMLDECRDILAREPRECPVDVNRSSDPVYTIFTSGSTGLPKGVIINHSNLANLLAGLRQRIYRKYPQHLRVALVSPYIFDASVKQIFAALCSGHTLYIVPEDTRVDGFLLQQYFISHGIDVCDGTPTHLQILMESSKTAGSSFSLKHLLIGGEALPKVVAEKFLSRFNHAAPIITNVYGPTECCVDASSFDIFAAPAAGRTHANSTADIPIGSPMPNYRLYITDPQNPGQLRPAGVVGELCIAGEGVSAGYLNSPELTAEKFIPNPFPRPPTGEKDCRGEPCVGPFLHPLTGVGTRCSLTSERLYKTGDLAMWQSNGNILFVGRRDEQVKIRGYRLEIGEIENQLLKHEKISEVVVIVRGEQSTDKNLCAYFVPVNKDAFEKHVSLPEMLRKFLSLQLPDYMIPTYFVQSESLPLTPNGKIDRRALPEPDIDGAGYTPPRGHVDEKLIAIWSEVLKLEPEQIGIDTDFFEIGGHSLRATVLISRIHKTYDIRVPLQEIFKVPTVRGIADYLTKCEPAADKFYSIKAAEKKKYYPLSSAQKGLYFIQQMDPGSASYNLLMPVLLAGPLNPVRLDNIFSRLITRHESLRTYFSVTAGEPRQRILPEAAFVVEKHEMNEEQVRAFIETTFARSFDLARAPLFRAGLIKVAAERHVLVVNFHHIIADGSSVSILLQEIMALYDGRELPPLRLQYKDFAQWQNSAEQINFMKKQEGFWLEQFAGEIPKLDLPTDYPRPVKQSFAGRRLIFTIAELQARRLKEQALEADVTLYMLLLAVFNIFLNKITNQEDIPVGTPVANRRHADLQSVVGMFVNMLVIRNQVNYQKRFSDFLQEVKQVTLKAYDNQDYKFEDLVDHLGAGKDRSRNPLFDVSFALQNMEIPTVYFSNLQLSPFDFSSRASRFDIIFIAYENGEQIDIMVEYCTALFKEETVRLFVKNFTGVLTAVLANPEIQVSEVEMLSEAERRQLLFDFNDTGTNYPADSTIWQLFAEQAEKTPDNTSLAGVTLQTRGIGNSVQQVNISYRKLKQEVDILASVIASKGVAAGSIIALLVERSIEMIAAILAILKVDGAYLPIETVYPQERIRYMLADSGAKLLLTTSSRRKEVKKLSSLQFEKIFIEECRGEPFARPPRHSTSKPLNFSTSQLLSSPELLAYIIYTSGTTGKAKGVLTRHFNVTRVVKNTNYIEINHRERVLQLSNYAFDGSVFDIYGALLNGAALVLIRQEDLLAVHRLPGLIKGQNITMFFVTTALFNALVDIDVECFTWTNKVLFGGERVSVRHSAKALKHLGKNRIIHVYGPTETTVYASYYFINEIGAADADIPIGMPISDTIIYILDKNMRLTPIGVKGEIFIAGSGTARGYLNSPELTADKFIRNPFPRPPAHLVSDSAAAVLPTGEPDRRGEPCVRPFLHPETDVGARRALPSERLYKTGDLARRLPDGNIQFLGRIDQQVKIRGFRIEPGEIENLLRKHKEVKETVVIDRENPAGERYLCAYIVPPHSGAKTVNSAELRKYLARTLPGYMLPAYFIYIDKIPLTHTGKCDRASLPLPENKYAAVAGFTPPADEIEDALAEIWAQVLGLNKEAVGTKANFFELGGHSLNTTSVTARIQDRFGVTVSLIEFLENPTIEHLASVVKSSSKAGKSQVAKYDNPILLKAGTADSKHLFFVHAGSGEVEGYSELCNYMPPDFNYWGIKADRIVNHAPRNITIAEVANKYIEKIKRIQPAGPYYIAGWCIGGTIAFEIVRQLEEMNEKISLMTLINSRPPLEKARNKKIEFAVKSELKWLSPHLPDSGLRKQLKKIQDLDKFWPRIVEHLEKSDYSTEKLRGYIPPHITTAIPKVEELDTVGLINYLNMVRTFDYARNKYIPPQRIKTTVHFVSAKQGEMKNRLDWNRYCTEEVIFIETEGDHFSIFQAPQVQALAQLFDNIMVRISVSRGYVQEGEK